MAKKIKMWSILGPKLKPQPAAEPGEVVESLVGSTNQTKGSISAVLAELDVFLINALKAGRAVRLPNGMTFRPYGKRDGSITIKLYLPKAMETKINTEQRAAWLNADNIGKPEAEIIAQWNDLHPDDLIEP